MSTQSLQNSNANVTTPVVAVFAHDIAEMGLIDLAAVYDGLIASSLAFGAISQQPRCWSASRYTSAGEMLSGFEVRARDLASIVVATMEPIGPDGTTEASEKLRILVDWQILCGATAGEIRDLAASAHNEQQTVVAKAA